ncbi:hypothetical protein K439DRAFT_1633304, partial [Ramaria rubella]
MLGFHLLAPCRLLHSAHHLLISTSAHRCSAPPHHILVLHLPRYHANLLDQGSLRDQWLCICPWPH